MKSGKGVRAAKVLVEDVGSDDETPKMVAGAGKLAHRLSIAPDFDKKGPIQLYVQQARDPQGPQYRMYTDKHGKVVSKARLVTSIADFEKRASMVGKSDYHTNAVGLATSSVYRGAENIEMDLLRKGVRGIRMAGSQYIDVVEPYSDNLAIGERLFVVLINPVALGGRLQKAASMYEQCKAMHLKFIYKPLVPATTTGSCYMYFRNDTQNPIYETGLDELMHASDRSPGEFKDFSVWNSEFLEIDPSNTNLKYWDETANDFAEDVQGMLTLGASSALAAGTSYGHLYLEYDYEFYASELDYETQEIGITYIHVTWTTYTSATSAPVRLIGTAPAAGVASFAFVNGTTPDSPEYLFVGTVTDNIVMPAGLAWCSPNDTETHTFHAGQAFYFRLTGTSGVFTDSTTSLLIYDNLASASGVVIDTADAAADGQLLYKAGSAGNSESLVFRCRRIPLASGQE